jgi:hypothetical protein
MLPTAKDVLGDMGPVAEEAEDYGAMGEEVAAEELIAAVKSGDAKSVAAAFKSMMALCKEMESEDESMEAEGM